MLEGKCPKCGLTHVGWALRFPRNQSCPACGSGLDIREGNRVFKGYSPFTAESYPINKPADIALAKEKQKKGDKLRENRQKEL